MNDTPTPDFIHIQHCIGGGYWLASSLYDPTAVLREVARHVPAAEVERV